MENAIQTNQNTGMLKLLALATMLAGVIPTPSGYGSMDAMIVLLFHPLLERAKLVSLVIVYRVVVSLFPFLVGAAVAARPIRYDDMAETHVS